MNIISAVCLVAGAYIALVLFCAYTNKVWSPVWYQRFCLYVLWPVAVLVNGIGAFLDSPLTCRADFKNLMYQYWND